MSNYQLLLNRIKRMQSGIQDFIPNPHARMSTVFNLGKAMYTLIGSVTGSGKTSFVDDTYILRPYKWAQKQNDSELHFECIYYSMERKKIFKIAKWTSWCLFENQGIKIPYDSILGMPTSKPLTTEQTKIVFDNRDYMDKVFDAVDIQDGSKTVLEIRDQLQRKAFALGSYFHTDYDFLYKNNVKQIISFEKHGKFKITKRGKVKYILFNYKNKVYELFENSNMYISHKANTFVFVVFDHIGKIKIPPYKSKKLAIDALDEVMSEARDKYEFSPIPISQFNRDVSNILRIKNSKESLVPLLEDFKDSGNPSESADLVVSLFDPYRYKSYDSNGMYQGYDITNGTLSPTGAQRFRSLHLLKNSYGLAQVAFGMQFTGELMHFKHLPSPDDKELAKIYEDIANGH